MGRGKKKPSGKGSKRKGGGRGSSPAPCCSGAFKGWQLCPHLMYREIEETATPTHDFPNYPIGRQNVTFNPQDNTESMFMALGGYSEFSYGPNKKPVERCNPKGVKFKPEEIRELETISEEDALADMRKRVTEIRNQKLGILAKLNIPNFEPEECKRTIGFGYGDEALSQDYSENVNESKKEEDSNRDTSKDGIRYSPPRFDDDDEVPEADRNIYKYADYLMFQRSWKHVDMYPHFSARTYLPNLRKGYEKEAERLTIEIFRCHSELYKSARNLVVDWAKTGDKTKEALLNPTFKDAYTVKEIISQIVQRREILHATGIELNALRYLTMDNSEENAFDKKFKCEHANQKLSGNFLPQTVHWILTCLKNIADLDQSAHNFLCVFLAHSNVWNNNDVLKQLKRKGKKFDLDEYPGFSLEDWKAGINGIFNQAEGEANDVEINPVMLDKEDINALNHLLMFSKETRELGLNKSFWRRVECENPEIESID